MRAHFRNTVATLIGVLILSGCPRHFDPAAAPAVKTDDQDAERRFNAARQQFDQGGVEAADRAFAQFISMHPRDPLAPLALVYRGRIALGGDKLARAREHLKVPAQRVADDVVGLQARYYLGLAAVRQGSHEEGRKLLLPFLNLMDAGAQPPLLAALALAATKLKNPVAAAKYLGSWFDLTKRPAERALAKRQLEELVERKLTSAQLKTLLDGAGTGTLLAALCARRLAGMARTKGAHGEAAALLRRSGAALCKHGARPAPGDTTPGLVGLMVPLSGRFKAAGEQLLAGALEGAEPGQTGGIRLVIRDCARDPGKVARRLLEHEGVSALVGTLAPAAAQAVALEAAAHGVPFITTAPGAAGQKLAPNTFKLFRSNRARAEALIRRAVSIAGARKLAILAPSNRFGKAMARVAVETATALGASVELNLSYPAGTRSFTAQARKLKKVTLDALFVPDSARALSLIAPALAREGLWAAGKTVTKGKDARRRYMLLATADGLSRRELTTSARYLEGSVLAPGFYPDSADPTSGAQVLSMEQSLGRPPTLLEAFAHDSIALLGSFSPENRSGPGLLTALSGAKGPSGLTGPLQFSKDGARSSPPNLYTVSAGQILLLK